MPEKAPLRAATHGLVRPGCLVRSLAPRDLVLADGIFGASIRIDFRPHQSELAAHT